MDFVMIPTDGNEWIEDDGKVDFVFEESEENEDDELVPFLLIDE